TTARHCGALAGVASALLLAAVPARANSYHVDLDAGGVSTYASGPTVGWSGLPTNTYSRQNVRGAEIHASPGIYIPAYSWGEVDINAPTGTFFLNSAVYWTACSPNNSQQFTSVVTNGYGVSELTRATETGPYVCSDHVYPAGSWDPTLRTSF